MMKNVIAILSKSKMQYLATIGLDGKPKVRPFQFMFEEDGKLWFCTSNKKEVYKEIQKQPHVELCTSIEDKSWLRIKAKVVFNDNLKIKEKVFEVSPLVKGIYEVPSNPAFEVFYLEEITVSIAEIGRAPVIYSLP
ncbi:MAG: pyridoxamine 5'-phosphate oxidase family protein [Bacteroidales bacterium]